MIGSLFTRFMRAIAVFAVALALPAAAAVAATSDTLSRILAGGKIVVGYRDAAPPFSRVGAVGPEGFSIDICARTIAAMEQRLRKKVSVEYVPVTSQTRLEMLKSGRIDIECGTTTDTATRRGDFAFSYPFFITGVRMAVPVESTVKDYNDLRGMTVAVVVGATAKALLEARREVARAYGVNWNIVEVADNTVGVRAVLNKKVHAFVADDVLLAGAISSEHMDDAIKRVGPLLSVEPYAMVVRKNDVALYEELRIASAQVLTSGEPHKLAQKWFGAMNNYKPNALTRETWAFPADHPAVP